MRHVTLPPTPKVELEVVRDRTAEGQTGFLDLRRLELVARRGGEVSKPFAYDVLDRRALDACVMIAHQRDARGEPCVWLRSALRPPLGLRRTEPRTDPVLWELPAGLVEPGETPRAAAARELDEELGFRVGETELTPLGGFTAPAPGFVGELHFFFHVAVDPASRREPAGDGSPLEDGALCVAVPLVEALEACRRGAIRDAKTELALRRMAETIR
jgi:ADP-ribose pyrophosphatase